GSACYDGGVIALQRSAGTVVSLRSLRGSLAAPRRADERGRLRLGEHKACSYQPALYVVSRLSRAITYRQSGSQRHLSCGMLSLNQTQITADGKSFFLFITGGFFEALNEPYHHIVLYLRLEWYLGRIVKTS